MGDKGSLGQPMGGRPFAPPKRKRLSRACNWCRNQKVRCDESLPSCNNCRLRNLHCLTTEPKTGEALSSADRKHSAKHSKNNPPCRSDPDSPYSSTTASSATSLPALPTPTSEPCRPPSTTLASASNAPLPVTWTSSATPGTTFATPRASSHEGPLQSPPKPPIRPAAAGDQIPPGPAHPTPQSSDYALNYGDEPVRRKFLGASSSQVLVQWLDLSFSRRGPWPNISHFFRYGISTAEEFSPTLWISPKPLPHHSECAKYLSVYKLRIHPLFPVLDLSDFASTFTKLSGKDARSVSASDLPSLACCHAVTSIGMDAISGKPSETATEYLSGAYSMYAHIVAMPYQRSIQALLLLALALRTRHKEGVAWHVIGHAIRMAQSLGLHRHQGSQEDTIPDMELDRNIWWSLFCLEKMMALQTGRPSAIHDEDCDQTTPPTAATCSFLHHLVGLAQVQSAIARSMTTQSGRRRGMHEFLHDTLQLDHQLVEWEQKLPNNLRPGSALYCTPEDQPFASFFSVSYHEALITLHRTALILDTHVFREQIKRHVPEIQASYRLSRAEDICVASARTIVQMLNELKGSCGDFVHPITASSPLLATFVLTISILKHPGRWNVRSDLALLLNIASLTEGIFQSIGQDPAFNKMFALMRDAASKHTEHANPHPEASHIGGQSQANRTDGSDSARRVDLSELPTNNEISYSLQPSDAFDLSSEEPWARLLSGNLDFEGGPWDFNLESFLGLPNFEEGALWL